MDKQAFKQRMRELKSYREQNPGKGYLDWKAASRYAEGGEVPPVPPERMEYKGKLYTDKLGRRYTEEQYQDYLKNSTDEISKFDGSPMVRGLKPIVDIEDAANFTPIGDAIAVGDTYTAIKNNDWVGAGLAALTMVPFVPTSVKNFRRKYSGITPKAKFNTTVNKNATANAIDALDIERARRQAIIDSSTQLLPKANNQGYRIAERLMEDPDYIARASQVKKQFGDDYLTTYADILQAYNETPELLPKASFKFYPDNAQGRAAMETTAESTARHRAGGEFAGMGEYNYRIDPSRTDLSGNVTEHEWNHYVDFLKNKAPDAGGNSNMFYQMSKDMDGVKIDSNDSYFRKGTEQKAYMNQLREYMFDTGLIRNRGDKVSSKVLQTTLKSLKNKPKMSPVFRASQQFKSPQSYAKWFNSIPLLGVGAIGVNSYFANGDEDIR